MKEKNGKRTGISDNELFDKEQAARQTETADPFREGGGRMSWSAPGLGSVADFYDSPWGLLHRSALKGTNWRPPPPPRSPDVESWPLDVPDVELVDYKRLLQLPVKDPEVRGRLERGVALCTDPREFEALFFERRTTGVFARESRDFEPHLSYLLKRNYLSRGAVKRAIVGFTIPKMKKRTLRGILDGRPVNQAQKPPPRTALATMEDIEVAVREYGHYCELDGKGWFNQFGMDDKIQENWGLKIGGEWYRWTRLPMGWSYSVFVAHTATEALASFELEGVRILIYIDNVYVFGRTKELVDQGVDIFLDRCKQVGATFTVTTPTSTSGTILGIHADLEKKTFCLPEDFVDKVAKLRSELSGLFQNERVSTRELWVLFGNLMWAARILHEPLYRYPRWMAWVSQRARQLHANPLLWDKPCHIWPTALSDLKALTTRVCDNRVYDLHQQEVTTEVFTDASDKGYGVVIPDTEEGGGQTYAAWWTISMRKHTIAERELVAAVLALAHLRRTEKGKTPHYHLYTDNTNVVAWLTRRRGPNFFVNALLRDLFDGSEPFQLSVTWIPSAANPADGPSRDPSKYRGLDWPATTCVEHENLLKSSTRRSEDDRENQRGLSKEVAQTLHLLKKRSLFEERGKMSSSTAELAHT